MLQADHTEFDAAAQEKIMTLEALVMDASGLESLESLLGEFNIFEAVGMVDQEIRHSSFLAFLLDPQQNHGLYDTFAKRLLQRALTSISGAHFPVSPIDLDVWDFNQLIVLREWRQNIDILLLDETNQFAVIIENKIHTSEHSNQLQRYWSQIEDHYPNFKILGLYLTPKEDRPSDERYIPISYDTVCAILEDLIASRASTLGQDILTLINHYTSMVRRYIVSESEIAELCRRIYQRHKVALDMIYKFRPDMQTPIYEMLERLISEIPVLELDYSSKNSIRFGLKEWDTPVMLSSNGRTRSGRILQFGFENQPDRLRLMLYIDPGPPDIRQQLYDMVAHSAPPLRASGKLGIKWNQIYSHPFLSARDYKDSDFEDLANKIQVHWQHFVSTDLPAIRSAITVGDILPARTATVEE